AESAQKLDDVLMAMDVVDTIRHREQMLARDLDVAGREEDLVERLRDIYQAQGIDVPDRIIRDGVKALEEKRFAYEPASPGLGRRLAMIYISRARWWKPAAAVLALIFGGLGVYQIGIAGPRAAEARAAITAITETLPAALTAARQGVNEVSEDPGADRAADALALQGRQALGADNRAGAEAAIAALKILETDLAADYQVRIVQDPDDFSGVFREATDDPSINNFYLIVEAVDGTGRVIEVPVTSEEDRRTARVTRWGQRVSRSVFDAMAADKGDDRIIQNAIIGEKKPGRLYPDYDVSTPGGAILEW
ncbi:MAG: DUF6384 family protein, partial [Pseudomonadota bacterium]